MFILYSVSLVSWFHLEPQLFWQFYLYLEDAFEVGEISDDKDTFEE